jgi:hypothetical protein
MGFGDSFHEGQLEVPVSTGNSGFKDGDIWYRSDLEQLKTKVSGSVYTLSVGEDDSGDPVVIWNNGGNKINTTSSVAIAGNEGDSYYADSAGSDLLLFVSGAIGGKTRGEGVALFGGDTVHSGTIYGRYPVANGTEWVANVVGPNGVQIDSGVSGHRVIVGSNMNPMGPPASDAYLSVSGSVGGKASGEGVALFGGDTVVSGTIYNAYGSQYTAGILDVKTKTSDYTLQINDQAVFFDVGSGAATASLPNVGDCEGKVYHIKKLDGSPNSLLIESSIGENIDGSAGQTIVTQFNSIMLAHSGSDWLIL